jgi:transcriptional regulator with GAF, ATPase, and Fis domain
VSYLIVREPGQVAFLVELTGELTVGRDSTNLLVLHDGQVSRRHLRLESDDAGWRVHDLGSTHGTRVNGAAAAGPRALGDGDVIQVGGVVLVYRDGTAPQLGGAESIVRTITQVVEPPERPHGAEARRLRVLFDVGRVIGALGDPDHAIERVLDMTLEVLACERGLVGLLDGGAIGRRIARSRGAAGLDDLAIGGAALAAIVERGESVLCRDPSAGAAAPGSAMGAPLIAGGRVLGYLYVDDRARARQFAPDDLDFLSALARLAGAALDQAEIQRRASAVVETVASRGIAPLLGDSEPMRRLRAQIARCAPATDVAVLVHGETGTGKELVAAHLHALSPRADQPLVAVNCAAIPDNLVESELFGHHKGAFTGAERARRGRFACAHRGTLFLDEIGDLGPAAQAKLLRAIETGEIHPVGAEHPIRVDVRIVAASHKDLAAEVEAGRFRDDLFYRLDVVEIEVPPLRVRGDDVIILAEQFRDDAARRLGRPRLDLSPGARTALLEYGWPGNVRQLQHEIERALLLVEGARIEADDLRLRRAPGPTPAAAPAPTPAPGDAGVADPSPAEAGPVEPGGWTPIEDAERQLVERALRAHEGNLRATARSLGIARATLYRKIKKYGLT